MEKISLFLMEQLKEVFVQCNTIKDSFAATVNGFAGVQQKLNI